MSTEPELTCKELVEIVTEYLEGTLPAGERARFEEHIGECGACRTYLDQMRTTIGVLGKIPEDSLSPEAREQLLAAFRNWKSRA